MVNSVALYTDLPTSGKMGRGGNSSIGYNRGVDGFGFFFVHFKKVDLREALSNLSSEREYESL